MTECPNKEKNQKNCPCDYEPCPRRPNCCECILYHKKYGGSPACLS